MKQQTMGRSTGTQKCVVAFLGQFHSASRVKTTKEADQWERSPPFIFIRSSWMGKVSTNSKMEGKKAHGRKKQ
jgi:hypothetical protein